MCLATRSPSRLPRSRWWWARSGPAGATAKGLISSRFRGGGAKKAYRAIDFKRDKFGIPAKVAAIEYDPNRTARIALLNYADGEKRYIICPVGLTVGRTVSSGAEADILIGNALPLKNIPAGTVVHNIELRPGKGAQMARSAGAQAQLVSREGGIALLKLPSGEIRRVQVECMATIGQVGNVEHENESHGKAGKTRWLGKKPHNRGVSMNPVDHPHGGGEGKTFGRPASGDALGPAHARIQDAQQQAHGQVDREPEGEEAGLGIRDWS